ncbi:TPA: hypothetical protein ACPFMZ_000765 [Legionella pneumophila]
MSRDTKNLILKAIILFISLTALVNHAMAFNLLGIGPNPKNLPKDNDVRATFNHCKSCDKSTTPPLIITTPVPIIYYPGCRPIQSCDAYGHCEQKEDCY